ncbi:DUF4136 domain-containing protein [Gaetbulibacter sp. NE]|uniref:DUF4136 domain-containing protein n=1 Tax=Gaetbulibacter sp. NE TaxID=2982307 RepID=UPI0021CFD4FC|nr:DUF4136 domain-containing protein [Gaetbulibacter sp. NE]
MRYLSLIVVLFLVSCAPIRVNYDYETTTDFTTYKTYNYYANIQSGLNELDTNRLMKALDEELQNKGFSLSETPDFFIDIKSDEFRDVNRNSVGVGLGGGGRNVGGGVSIGIPVGQSNLNRQIIIDFVDENGVGLFWQAVSEDSFNPNAKPDKREAKFKAIVVKVLENYPPKK